MVGKWALAVVALVGTLVCGLSGVASAAGPASDNAFCRRLSHDQQLLASSASPDTKDTGPVLAELDRLRRAAPSAIKREMEHLVSVARKLAKANPKDPRAFAEVFAAVLDPKVIKASNKVKQYAHDTCKVDLEPLGDSNPSPSSPPATGESGSGMDASAIRSYLATSSSGKAWAGRVNGVGVIEGTQVEVDTDLTSDPTSKTAAVEICRATSTYVYDGQHVKNATISVQGRDHQSLAQRTGSAGSCAG